MDASRDVTADEKRPRSKRGLDCPFVLGAEEAEHSAEDDKLL